MRQHRKKTIPARETTEIASVTCDVCGKKGDRLWNAPYNFEDEEDWDDSSTYSFECVAVRMAEGASYPEGGQAYELTRYDICPDCFKGKVMPFLAELGAQPSSEEVDW